MESALASRAFSSVSASEFSASPSVLGYMATVLIAMAAWQWMYGDDLIVDGSMMLTRLRCSVDFFSDGDSFLIIGGLI